MLEAASTSEQKDSKEYLRELRQMELREEDIRLKAALQAIPPMSFSRTALSEGSDNFYGSVSAADIIKKLKDDHGLDVESGEEGFVGVGTLFICPLLILNGHFKGKFEERDGVENGRVKKVGFYSCE
jgi:CBS domain containing-hemolysin-like protein